MSDIGFEPPAVAADLAADDNEFREYVRHALGKVVLPSAETWEGHGRIETEGWRGLGELGLLALGHTGDEFMRSAIFLEELGRTGYAGVRAAIAVHAYMAPSYLEMFGTAEQKAEYLPDVRLGRRVWALAITEPDAGSDLRHLKTRADDLGPAGYKVNGQKYYVANGSQADYVVTLVKTRPAPVGRALTGASILLIDAGSPGVSRCSQPMMGWRSADLCSLRFIDVLVPANRLLGRLDRALVQIVQALDFERLVAGLLAVGGISYCLELLHAFIREHQVMDSPLDANQALRHQVAELDCDFQLVRQYAYHAARLQSRGRLDSRTASILKLKATELAVTAAQKCVQYHGARGYLKGSAPARLYCDAMGSTIAGGASELMREMIYQAW
jgi:acyl-CoA dehydrogenase